MCTCQQSFRAVLLVIFVVLVYWRGRLSSLNAANIARVGHLQRVGEHPRDRNALPLPVCSGTFASYFDPDGALHVITAAMAQTGPCCLSGSSYPPEGRQEMCRRGAVTVSRVYRSAEARRAGPPNIATNVLAVQVAPQGAETGFVGTGRTKSLLSSACSTALQNAQQQPGVWSYEATVGDDYISFWWIAELAKLERLRVAESVESETRPAAVGRLQSAVVSQHLTFIDIGANHGDFSLGLAGAMGLDPRHEPRELTSKHVTLSTDKARVGNATTISTTSTTSTTGGENACERARFVMVEPLAANVAIIVNGTYGNTTHGGFRPAHVAESVMHMLRHDMDGVCADVIAAAASFAHGEVDFVTNVEIDQFGSIESAKAGPGAHGKERVAVMTIDEIVAQVRASRLPLHFMQILLTI